MKIHVSLMILNKKYLQKTTTSLFYIQYSVNLVASESFRGGLN